VGREAPVGALVNLQLDEALAVEPGRTATTELTLVNTGTIVEQFTILLLGDVAPWTSSDPPVVSLFPGAQQTVTLQFAPPRTFDVPSGPVPFGVKVIPSNEPEESVTEEGVITVGGFTDVGAELVPRVATARLTGHQKLAVDSRSNVPLPVVVSAIDASDALKFRFRPQKLTTAPGEARYVRVKIKPRRLFWKGHPQHKPYQVQVAPEGERPLVLEGSLTQKPVFPKWFFPFLAIAAALLLLWFLVLRPIVHNDAVNANKAALAVQAAQTRALANQVAAANKAAKQAGATAAAAAALAAHKPLATTTSSTTTTTVVKAIVKTGKAAATTTATTAATAATTTTATTTAAAPPPGPVTGPNDNEINVITLGDGSRSITVAPQNTLEITDLVLENVAGQPGRAEVQRTPAGANAAPVNLLVENLGTLTDQEYHFDTPIVLRSGEKLTLLVNCQSDGLVCNVNLYFTGPLTQPPPTTTP
jgi:hypothetical protein